MAFGEIQELERLWRQYRIAFQQGSTPDPDNDLLGNRIDRNLVLTYYEYANANAMTWIKEGMKKWAGSSQVPAAFALFPKDISQPPREWAERFFNVQRWTEMASGGHFAAMEEPELLAEDVRTWFRPFREDLAAS